MTLVAIMGQFHHVKCRIEKHLGSGQFGTVEKGLWFSTQGPMEVAVKALKQSSEKETVMLLQEAAIMGQFHHPNVVKLLGVVTMGEPVSNLTITQYTK